MGPYFRGEGSIWDKSQDRSSQSYYATWHCVGLQVPRLNTKHAKIAIDISYCIISYHIISHHIISYHITSYHIISYHIISYHIISHHIISYHIISYHIISYHIISYHIISYHIISYHIISYHIISYHIISYHIISYHIISSRRANLKICGSHLLRHFRFCRHFCIQEGSFCLGGALKY